MKKNTFLKMFSAITLWVCSILFCVLSGVLLWIITSWGIFQDSYFDSIACNNLISSKSQQVIRYFDLISKVKNQELDYPDTRELNNLKEELGIDTGSNFIWRILDSQGSVILTNLQENENFSTLVYGSNHTDFSLQQDNDDPSANKDIVYLEYGVRKELIHNDKFMSQQRQYYHIQKWLIFVCISLVAIFILSIVLFCYLAVSAGYQKGNDKPSINGFDRIWLEPLLCILVLLMFLVIRSFQWGNYVEFACLLAVFLGMLITISLSVIRRAKAKMLYKTTFVNLMFRLCLTVIRHISLSLRIVGIAIAFMLLQLIALVSHSFILMVVVLFLEIAAAILAFIIGVQFLKVQKATERMANGDLQYYLNENNIPFFAKMARNLNSTHKSIQLSIERATKSERMKTELITNVSHDIKTPLTSIISYVGLLKNTHIEDEKALEYIKILENKSKRLAQLMIDLIEASKVTSGNITVNIESININELLKQAGAEYESRLEERGIELICHLPDTPLYVLADGRHMWRVLDNLFGNAVKYAMDHTRVYIDVADVGSNVVLSVKNISRDPLNINPDELLERFVRGDSSRSSQGSGLGLSIAKSLIEIQHGTLNLQIDGDLFKVILVLPKPPQKDKVSTLS